MSVSGEGTDEDAGFTLVEMLVVLAIVSLLASALFGSLRFGILAWQRTAIRSAEIDQNLVVQDFLRRAIAGAYPQFVIDDPTHGHVDFIGANTSISFVGLTPAGRGAGGHSRFVVAMNQTDDTAELSVSSQLELAPPETISKVRDVLMTKLRGVEFSYFGKSKSGTLQWQDSWTGEATLPRLVRIRVRFPDGDRRTWPELLIAPRIDADVGCAYDLLAKRCRGR